MAYNVKNLDHLDGTHNVRCLCGSETFATPEPPTDPFFTGRFHCTECAARWSTENIVQNVAFVAVA